MIMDDDYPSYTKAPRKGLGLSNTSKPNQSISQILKCQLFVLISIHLEVGIAAALSSSH